MSPRDAASIGNLVDRDRDKPEGTAMDFTGRRLVLAGAGVTTVKNLLVRNRAVLTEERDSMQRRCGSRPLTEQCQTRFRAVKLLPPKTEELAALLTARWSVPKPTAVQIAVCSGG